VSRVRSVRRGITVHVSKGSFTPVGSAKVMPLGACGTQVISVHDRLTDAVALRVLTMPEGSPEKPLPNMLTDVTSGSPASAPGMGGMGGSTRRPK
jgi:hypothetical protein